MQRTIHNRVGRASLLAMLSLLALVIGGAVSVSMYQSKQHVRQCERHLTQIFRALQDFEQDHGHLPYMAFYPQDGYHDADSLLVVLDPYAVTEKMTLCRNAHEMLATRGISYVWNVDMNGRRLDDQSDRVWLLTDAGALSPHVAAPHRGRYLTLYSDGTVERTRARPQQVMGF